MSCGVTFRRCLETRQAHLRKKCRHSPLLGQHLRSVKYALLAFFIYIVVLKMPSFAIMRFLEGDYYKIADVKMLLFFIEMTTTTAVSLSLLFVLSLFYKNFWCRYLCPYGALLGLISFFQPLKITRNNAACIHCGTCTKNCPSLLPVERLTNVRSPECTDVSPA